MEIHTECRMKSGFRNVKNRADVLPAEDERYKAAFYSSADESYSVYIDGSDSEPNMENSDWNIGDYLDGVWEVGSGAQEKNGTYDMMGNVYEWTETVSGDDSYGVCGGSFESSIYTSSSSTTTFPDNAGDFIGFCVAAIPEPASMALMDLFGRGILFVRRIFML